MATAKILHFQSLKNAIEEQFRLVYPDIEARILDWKGKEIKLFQEQLSEKVGGYISEKWFYTHIKNPNNTKLPRIDMLNMLASYVGFDSWELYCEQEALKPPSVKQEAPKVSKQRRQVVKKSWLYILVLLLGVGGALSFIFLNKKEAVTICFIDSYTKKPVTTAPIELILNDNKRNENSIFADSTGCVSWLLNGKKMTVLAKAPYYKPKAFDIYTTTHGENRFITLEPDDYAMMLHYFSTTKVEDWKRRRSQLDEIIADHAKIIQVLEVDGVGMELYNKDEFINKLTLPISSLRNIEILHTEYEDGKIVFVRFVQKN